VSIVPADACERKAGEETEDSPTAILSMPERRAAVEKSASELAQLWRDARADQIDPTLVICRCAWNQVPCLPGRTFW
jgi:hypothetical protein